MINATISSPGIDLLGEGAIRGNEIVLNGLLSGQQCLDWCHKQCSIVIKSVEHDYTYLTFLAVILVLLVLLQAVIIWRLRSANKKNNTSLPKLQERDAK